MTRSPARFAAFAGLVAAIIAFSAQPFAQTPRVLKPEESGRWETLVPSTDRLGLSPDGAVLAYRVDRSNWEDELRIVRIADGHVLTVPYGKTPRYSSDGKWLIYTTGVSQEQEDQLKRDRRPVRDGLGLLELATFTETRFSEVNAARFSDDGAYLAMERYAAAPVNGRAGGARRNDNAAPRFFVRTLATGNETAFDNVQQFSWQPRGRRLGMLMGGDNQGGARVQMFDVTADAASAIVKIDESPASYSRLTWRADGTDIAYLRSRSASTIGLSFDVVAVRGAGSGGRALTVYDTARDTTFPTDTRIVDFRELTWSDDGRVIFVGTASAASAQQDGARGSRAGVRVWHWTDVEVMPLQVENAAADRRRSSVAAVSIDDSKLTRITTSLNASATPMHGPARALIAEWDRYAMQRTIGRAAADISIVDARTGQKTLIAEAIDDDDVNIRPDGGAIAFPRDGHLWVYDAAAKKATDVSASSGAAFINAESDSTAPAKPLFGVAGWSTDGTLLAYDRYDIWRVNADGTSARKLTNGAASQLVHRLVNLNGSGDRAAGAINFSQPVYLSVFGERTKQFGYARIANAQVEPLVLVDRRVDQLTVSANGNVFGFVSQNFDVSPNIFIGGSALKDARAVTATNPQQAQYAWGRSAVIEYAAPTGEPLQAALYYPAGYTAGRRYPAIVKLYERLSDEVHNYTAPSDMDEANISVFTNLGYVVIAPDIRYRARNPGVSTVECVTAAIARAAALGVIDTARVGVIGHSWGAYESAFLATHTTNVFAAAVAGSAITDLVSQYGNHHWGSGVAETDHIETGQQRMQVPVYEDVDAYVRNSPIFGVPAMTTPLLLEAGDQDGDVFWHQSVELYNSARRAGKPVVLLQYPGEDHTLDDFDNRRDYQRRILAWFGHFLKNETAPQWITTGAPLVKR